MVRELGFRVVEVDDNRLSVAIFIAEDTYTLWSCSFSCHASSSSPPLVVEYNLHIAMAIYGHKSLETKLEG